MAEVENVTKATGDSMDWFERIPKVELHLHLEGAIPLPALWQLIAKYGGDPSVPDLDALERRFEYRDFAHFIDTWIWKNGFRKKSRNSTWTGILRKLMSYWKR